MVPGIRGRGGVAMSYGVRQAGVADGTGKTAVADALKLAVPSRGRHPNFELNIRVIHGLDDTGHAAKSRCVPDGWIPRWRVRACGNGLSGANGGGGKR